MGGFVYARYTQKVMLAAAIPLQERGTMLSLPLPGALKRALEKMKDVDEKPEDVPVEEQE